MPNLTLSHSGDMDITSASISSGGTLDVSYGLNATGKITGWTVTPDSGRKDLESGDTITVRFTPQYSGTVLTETFTVSGVDLEGIGRSDTSVIKQNFDTNLQHYIPNPQTTLPGVILNSSASTENYFEFNVTLVGTDSNFCQVMVFGGTGGAWPPAIWYGYIGVPATSITLNVDDQIVNSGVATVTVVPSGAITDFRFSSSDDTIASIDNNGAITVKSSGQVTFCVTDLISNLTDCKTVDVYTTNNLVTAVYNVPSPGSEIKAIYNVCSNVEYAIFDDGTVWTNEECPESGGNVTLNVSFETSGLHTAYIKTTDMTVPGFNVLPALRSLYIPDGYELENNYHNSVWYSGLQEIRLPSDLDVIPYGYFGGSHIQSINLPSSLRAIEDGAFASTPLTGITIPEGVTRIGDSYNSFIGAFSTCTGLTSVSLPNTLTFIGNGTFTKCTGLTEITIPNGVTTIGCDAFGYCSGLTGITIPSSVTFIDLNAFRYCDGLTHITFEGSVPPALGQNALDSTDRTFPIYVPCGAVDAYKAAYNTSYIDYADRIVCADAVGYLTFNITSSGQIKWSSNGGSLLTIQYKLNDGQWINITSTSGQPVPTISVSQGDVVMFKGNNQTYSESPYEGLIYSNSFRGSDCQFTLTGNIMSLVYGDDFNGSSGRTLPENCGFSSLFRDCSGLTDASRLVLPLGVNEHCYDNMFRNCKSLIAAPELPATVLANTCYRSMFYNCESLVSAPELLASVLFNSCYESMFDGCKSLNYIKCNASSFALNATYSWLYGVSATGTFIKVAGVSWPSGSSGIPTGWTVVE